MDILRTTVDDTPVIEVNGQIDMSNCHLLNDAINTEIAQGNYELVINLIKISYIDSSCLGVLLAGLEKAKHRGGSLAVVGNPLVDRVLTLTGLTRLFPFHSNIGEAVCVFRGPENKG